MTLRW